MKHSTTSNFSHALPPRWVGANLQNKDFKEEFDLLIKYLHTHDLSPQDILCLRESNAYRNLYYNFHLTIEEGSGVVLVRNSAFKNFDRETQKSIFLNLCCFFGYPVCINKNGGIVVEVKNTGMKDAIKNPVRGHMTSQELAFHSDRADITSLLCYSKAESGGEFKICSSSELFHTLLNYPEVIKILSEDIPHDLRGEGKDGQELCFHPVIHNNKTFVVRYIRRFIESVVRHGISLDNSLLKALDLVDGILNNPDFYFKINFNPGDIVFMNNHITLHARNRFEDSDKNQRCLFRVWLSSEFTRELPESFKPIFNSVLPKSVRGGII